MAIPLSPSPEPLSSRRRIRASGGCSSQRACSPRWRRDGWRKRPITPDTLRLLMDLRRYDEALQVLRRIADTRPDDLAAAFKAVGNNTREMLADAARNYGETLREIVADGQAADRDASTRAGRRDRS